ncbi:MAG: RraA family protein [Candidatus Acidiferrum sp.]
MKNILAPEQLESLRRLSTCAVSNAIETFDVRLRNAGFADASIRCMFQELPPTIGYAATARVRTSVPPMHGHNYFDRTDWWNAILKIPAPRVVVVEDVEKSPGLGSFVGEVHANILSALGCIAVVTNGAVRDLPQVRSAGFQFFAGGVAVSHAYAHIFQFGTPVEIGGLKIEPGDLLHGDQHGILKVPFEIASNIPAIARDIQEKEERAIAICRSADFSLEKLREVFRSLNTEPKAASTGRFRK